MRAAGKGEEYAGESVPLSGIVLFASIGETVEPNQP
jgi:hypothetical protein